MDISDCSFKALPYSKFFSTYTTDFHKLKQFFPYNPFITEDVLERSNALADFSGIEKAIKALSAFHEELDLENQHNQLQKLSRKNAKVVVTGQQLGMYGGPLFTIYKTITAILLAREYEKKTGHPVVPVFWLADEDHDFDEIAWAGIPGKDDFKKIFLNEEGNGNPVSQQILSENIHNFEEEIKAELFETDFSENVWEQIERNYHSGKTYVQAFAGLIEEWFSSEGLLIAGSNHPEIKKIIFPVISNSIKKADEIHEAIEIQSLELEKTYHRQVVNGDSNLFYLSESEGRVKIHKTDEGWRAGSIKWREELLLQEIEQHPEKFSPNVFLRPIIQDTLLPTLGYIAGPGELAYYGQMKLFYEQFNLEMPPIFPRLTATLIESGISRIIEKLPFEIAEYEKRIEDLEASYIEQSETVNLDEVFDEWKVNLKSTADNPLNIIDEIDPTLEGTVGKTLAGFENELDKLKGRVYRSIKQQQNVQLKRIERIKMNLFPDGLQERAVSPVYFMNKYGLTIWQELLNEIEENGLDLSKHHFVRL